MIPPPLVLPARESVPVPPPPPGTEAKPAEIKAPPPVIEAQAAPAQPAARNTEPAASNPIADRWGSMAQFAPSAAPPLAPAAAPGDSAPAALSSTPDPDEVLESATPAIEGPPPLPRRKPIVTASRRTADPPLA